MHQHNLPSLLLVAKYLLRYRLIDVVSRHKKSLWGRKSYSQAGQDLFALITSGFKSGGTYVEIGAHDPVRDNNSFLLEQDYKWRGLSFEIDELYCYFFNRRRLNQCICADATRIDYRKAFLDRGLPSRIDYLQIDIDPARQSLCALRALPLDEYRFGAITFEHDRYQEGDSVMLAARRILLDHGYVLLMPNIQNIGLDVEDWWVDPTQENEALLRVQQSGPLDYIEAIRLGLSFYARENID